MSRSEPRTSHAGAEMWSRSFADGRARPRPRSGVRGRLLLGAAMAGLALSARGPAWSASLSPANDAGALAASACNGLMGFKLEDVRVSSAAVVEPSAAWTPDPNAPGARPIAVGAPFCRVQGVIGREIGFELWLPEPTRWNGRLLGAGVGGDAGAFNFSDLPRGVAQGYAAATTDTGHKAADRTWMLGPPERLTNFELLAHHRLAVTAKLLLARYYGRNADHAYFIGCSGGGRQALKELQRFPADYDGVIAGAPGPDTPEMTTRRMWELIQREQHPNLLSPADWALVVEAAVRACDELDGVRDGVIADPRMCRFDPASLACPPGAAPGARCLTPDQLALVKTIYAPLRGDDGRKLDDGVLPGVLIDSGHSRLAPATFGQAIRKQADWDGEGFDVSRDLAAIDRVMPELRADDADISAFAKRGGKVIVYEGWNDPAVAARMVIAYYNQVVAKLGPLEAGRMIRLFMAPGVEHCVGGPGPDQFGGAGAAAPSLDTGHDLLSALDAWVREARAPERVVASKLSHGEVVETRPLCAYPAAAHYDGHGDTNSAASFSCRAEGISPEP